MMISIPKSPLAREIASVSVVIPCFRCVKTIRRAVESAFSQTLRPAELILVDDASGDGTLRTLLTLRQEFGEDWIKVIYLPVNGGPGTARNAGWDSAHSDYVAFLDADDSWHSRKIEVQYRWMRENPDVEVSGHLFGSGTDRRMEGEGMNEVHARVITSVMLLLSNRLTPSSVMLRRQLGFRFKPGKRHMEDHLLWLEIALSGVDIFRLEHALCHQYKAAFGDGGLSAQLWQMECGELENYRMLAARGLISRPVTFALYAFSLLKYCRRLVLKSVRQIWHPE
jgi:glycosyltransferase involved in cell wall biosynthesis